MTRLSTKTVRKTVQAVTLSTPRAADADELSSSEFLPTPETLVTLFTLSNGFTSVQEMMSLDRLY